MFLKNQKGVSLVYSLMALVAVGAIGLLILNMAKKEMTDTFLRSTTEAARYSANAGITVAVNNITDPALIETRAIPVLRPWYDNFRAGKSANDIPENLKWIVGTTDSFEERDGMQYRVEIIDIDFSRVRAITDENNAARNDCRDLNGNMRACTPEDSPIKISFKSESIDSTGSRSTSYGSYQFVGFEDKELPVRHITHALYLGGGSILINCDVDINGDTYIGGQNTTTPAIKHSTLHVINTDYINHYRGEFRLYSNDEAPAAELAGERFHGPAYFEGGNINFSYGSVAGTDPSWFYKGWGGSNVKFTHPNSKAVLKADSMPSNIAAFTNDVTYDAGSIILEGSSSIVSASSKEDVFEKIGMNPIEPTAFEIVLSDEIKAAAKGLPVVTGTIDGTFMNNWYYNVQKDDLYEDQNGNKWLVVETSHDAPFGYGNGTAFTGNAIIINRHGASGNSLFNVAKGSSVLFFIPPDVSIANVNYGNCKGTFNGLFYNGSTSTRFTLGGGLGVGWKVNGAFYNIGNRGDTENNAEIWIGANGFNGPVTIDFKSEEAQIALGLIENLGVVTWGSGGTTVASFQRIPESISPRVKAKMQSRSF